MRLIGKVERWWVVEVEMPVNPDFDGLEIDPQGVRSGTIISVDLMMKIALGTPEDSSAFLDAFRKYWPEQGTPGQESDSGN